MSKTKSQLRYGQWPDSPASAHHPAGLTVAAQRLAATALAELNRLGVTVELDNAGRARFRSVRVPPPAARLAIERHGDLIEAYLRELAPRLMQPCRTFSRSTSKASIKSPWRSIVSLAAGGRILTLPKTRPAGLVERHRDAKPAKLFERRLRHAPRRDSKLGRLMRRGRAVRPQTETAIGL